jgi:DNA-binding LacI/PurR family transcriptional regulator
LNAPEVVTEALRVRIFAAAQRLAYVPNLTARALTTRRSGLVGVIVDTPVDLLTAAFLDALDKPLRRQGFNTVLVFTAQVSEANVRELLARGVDALLSWEVSASSDARRMVAVHGKPWLMLHDPQSPGITGRTAGVALACRYMISLGHRRIGALLPERRFIDAPLQETLAGTRAQLNVVRVGQASDSSMAVALACGALLDRGDLPTAIVCSSDLDAMAVLRECHARRIDVPRDISVTGFGDTDLSKHAWPSLTTVRIAIAELSGRAVEALVAMLGGETPPVPGPAVKLVVRESTALAPR